MLNIINGILLKLLSIYVCFTNQKIYYGKILCVGI